ncbi:jg2194, partial [Pararge aegeria aegeria]
QLQMAKLIFLGGLALIGTAAWFFVKTQVPGSPPQLDLNEWWGPK